MREARASVTEAEVAAYERDGVVCLRGVLPVSWVGRMQAAVERVLDQPGIVDMTEMARSIEASGGQALVDARVEPAGERGRFYGGTDHWLSDPDFRAFAVTSPLPALVAALMRSDKVNLYEDSLLVKEPGTIEPTAFHQDLAYFHVEGKQICTSWSPLDPVTEETGAVQYVRGSHLWQREFRPNLFVSSMPIPGTTGDEVPDIRDRARTTNFCSSIPSPATSWFITRAHSTGPAAIARAAYVGARSRSVTAERTPATGSAKGPR